jgi:alpha 1,6-mannosyltransferase
VQWSIAAPPGHPVLLDAVGRIFATARRIANGEQEQDDTTVLNFSGPGVFSDCVLR